MIALRIIGLAVATGFCAAAALELRRMLRIEEGGTGVLAALIFFTALQSILIVAAGMTGLLSFWPLSAVGAFGWLALLARRRGRLGWPRLDGLRRQKAIAVLAVIGLLALAIKAIVLEPYTGDALMYHLPKIAEWVQARRFVWGTNHDPRIWFSSGFELVETWWVVFLHHDALVELAGIQMAVIASAAVWTLAKGFGAQPGFAAVLYGFIPVVILNSTNCGNDLGAAALTLAGYALVASRVPRAIQVFPLLLGLGMKATAGFASLGVVAFALLDAKPASRLPRWGSLLLGSSGILLAGFWYARNWIVAGHPLYPFHGIHGEFTWVPQQGSVDLDSLQSTIQALPRRLLDRGPYESLSPNAAGWGWAALPLGLPALLLGLREDSRFRRLAFSFALGACTTLACVWDDGQNLRFVLWLPALLAVAIARLPSRLWFAAGVLACAINFSATLIPYDLRHSRHLRVPSTVAPDCPVACVFADSAPSYRLYGHDFSRRVYYPRSMEDLRRTGAKVVYLFNPPGWAEEIRHWPSLGDRYYEVP